MTNIKINNLSKSYFVKNKEVKAIDDVSFQVAAGECYGIIGKNGAGKTTLLKLLSGYLKPSGGSIYYNGGISSLIDLGWSIHPHLSGYENIVISAGLLGIPKAEALKKTSEILKFSELDDSVMDRPLFTFSSGMYLKLAFSIMMAWPKLVMLFDEVLTVGDAGFAMKIAEKLIRLKEDGHTIILVSHNLEQINTYCDRVMILDNGKNVFEGHGTLALRHYYDMVNHKHHVPLANFEGFALTGTVVYGNNIGTGDIEVLDADHQIKFVFSFEMDHSSARKDIVLLLEDIHGSKLCGDDTFDWPLHALPANTSIEWVIPEGIINSGNFVLQVIYCNGRRVVGNAKVLHFKVGSSSPKRTSSMIDSKFYLKGALRPLGGRPFKPAADPHKLIID